MKKAGLILLMFFMGANKALTSPVIIASNFWTSQNVLSQILHDTFKKNGIESKLKKIKSGSQWRPIMAGKVHVQLEVWQGTMETYFEKAVKSGKAIDAGAHEAQGREEWWYPSYAEKDCPGLPDWKALKKCAAKFNRGKGTKGIYVAGPWEKPDKARIRALGLDFKVVPVKKGDDLWVELDKSVAKKEPIVLFNWSPNFIEAKYKGKFIEFPEYHPDCDKKASWGISKKWKYDCGNPKGAWIKKLVSAKLPTINKCAFEIVKNFNFTNKMIAEAALFVDGDKMTVQDASKAWAKKYQSKLDSWIPANCKK